jgi:hypothetical protein
VNRKERKEREGKPNGVVILSPSLCHSERSEESRKAVNETFRSTQGELCEESRKIVGETLQSAQGKLREETLKSA